MCMSLTVDLSGKAAIITGGASGIGRSIAESLTAHGARVVIADLNADQGEAVAQSLTGALFHRTDVTSRDDCRAVVDRAASSLGSVDILVNCAGIQHVSPVDEFPEDRWDLMMRIMITGPFLLSKYSLPHMYARGWGRIINLGSIHSLIASPYKSAYTAAKHGVLGFTKSLALEAADKGVTCNTICPSYVRTPLVERQIDDLATANNLTPERVVEEIMLAPAAVKRLLDTKEVAAYATYLCSDAASGITGSAQTIDCGWTAR